MREFGDLEDEIEKFSKTDFRVAAEAKSRLENLKGIMGVLRARKLHGKKKVPYGDEILDLWRKAKSTQRNKSDGGK